MSQKVVRSNSTMAVAMVLGSCTSLQIGAAFAMQLFPIMGAPGVTFLRLFIAALTMGLVVRPKVLGWTGRQWRSILLFGAVLGGMNLVFYSAIARIDLGVAVTIQFLGPLVLAAVLSKRGREKIWALIAFIGVVALGYEGFTSATAIDPVGVVYALVAAAFWAAYILASSRAGKDVPGFSGLAVAFMVGAVLVLPFGIGGAAKLITDPSLIPIALITALMASVVPFSLETAALRRLTPAAFGVLLSLEPVIALTVGILVLSQGITVIKAVAALIVVCASVASVKKPSNPPVEPALDSAAE